MMSEALTRKNRSIALLIEQEIPFIEHLPEIEDSSETVLRMPNEIADRGRCLFAVFFAVNRGEQSTALEIIRRFDLEAKLSTRERIILLQDIPDSARIDLSWGCEALMALVWALGAIEAMPPPTDGIHPDSLALGWSRISDAHWNGSAARSLNDVLDQCDLYFRYHWAVRDAWIKGLPSPGGLLGGLVLERHRAFNWLISGNGEDWDKVAIDT